MKKRNAFTIVELVIIIAVIAILAAVLIPTFSGIINDANMSSAKSSARSAVTKAEIFFARSGGVPDNMKIIVDNNGRFYAFAYTSSDGLIPENNGEPLDFPTVDEAAMSLNFDPYDNISSRLSADANVYVYIEGGIIDEAEYEVIDDECDFIIIDKNGSGQKGYSFISSGDYSRLEITEPGTYRVKNKEGVVTTSQYINVGSTEGETRLTLDGVNIKEAFRSPVKCIDNSNVTISLAKGSVNTLEVKSGSNYRYEGIHSPYKGVLTIKGAGELTVKGGDRCSGIGDRYDTFGGSDNVDVNIDIRIFGGTITATGGNDAAGIGSGGSSGVCNVNIGISGGNITAHGGSSASGIGLGSSFGSSNDTAVIKISEGTINAIPGYNAAGIGGGQCNDGSEAAVDIDISGGTVGINAEAGGVGIGIGGYTNCPDKINAKINISGGDIDIKTGGHSAGIGIGKVNGIRTTPVSDINISGGDIKIEVGDYSAGIGFGDRYTIPGTTSNTGILQSDITISGGSFDITAATGATGIGVGYCNIKSTNNENRILNNVTINGGVFNISAGTDSSCVGMGLYNDDESNCSITDIKINGGTITATKISGQHHIGFGKGYTEDSNITIEIADADIINSGSYNAPAGKVTTP